MNLKWNIAGTPGAFQEPPPEYIQYLKKKRQELIMMGITTGVGVTALMIAYAGAMGHLRWQVVSSILGFQVSSSVLGYKILESTV